MRRDYTDSSVYTGEEFWKALRTDILNAKARIIIYSPFVGMWQLDQVFERIFTTTLVRRVQVCIILQTPTRLRQHLQTEEQFKSKLNEFEQCVSWIKNKGIHVSFRKEIHEKLIVIDEHILWDGSNNVLAAGISSERMNRFASRQRVIDAMKDHKLSDCTDCQRLFEELGFTSLATQIKRTRKLRGVSQRLVARECGLNRTSVNRLEDNDLDLRLSTVNRVLQFLGAQLTVIPLWLRPSVALLLKHEEGQVHHTNGFSISFGPINNSAVPAVRESSGFHYALESSNHSADCNLDAINISFSAK